MLTSGNGQHRRPRQAPKFVVTMGATGAGMAIPLLSAGAAHAASVSTWDKVANCETGGSWSADGGDGFYGGLQLTQNVWERYGGTAYAQSPDLASRQQQIAVAEKVLDDQGPGYWTGCAVDAGLTRGDPAPDVDPGTDAPGGSLLGGSPVDPGLPGVNPAPGPGLLGSLLPPPAPPSPSTAPSGSATASPDPGATSPSSNPSATSAPSTASSSSSPSSDSSDAPTVSGSPAPAASGTTGTAPSGTPGASSGRHAKPPAVPGDGQGGAEQGPYTVQPGDNLYEIATKHELPGGWPSLYAANKSVVGSDPDLILPGQHLTLG